MLESVDHNRQWYGDHQVRGVMGIGFYSGKYNGVDWDIEFKNGKWYAEVYLPKSRIGMFNSKYEAMQWVVSTIKGSSGDVNA